jgi:D-alanyl-D-alanine dipeptidase
MLKKFLLIFYFITLIVFPVFVLAQTAATSETTKDAKTEVKGIEFKPSIDIPGSVFTDKIIVTGDTLGNYIVAVYRYGGIFAGIVAMFMLVYAGWEWLLAGGNSSKISQAKNKINGTLMGLLLLFGGYLLLSIISTNLISFKSLDASLPDIIKICPTITTEDTCKKSSCLWVPASAEQLRADESIANYCVPPLSTACPSESTLQDVNIPGLAESGCSDCRLTIETINKLKKAVAMLIPGEGMTITSAYRTFAKQQELYDCYQNKLKTGKCSCSSCNEAAKPGCDAPHQTGTAVDVCLRKGNVDSCKYIDKEYNCSNAASCPAGLYEVQQTLKTIMIGAGFTPYVNEWWHFQAY